jgi:hypothetical protein
MGFVFWASATATPGFRARLVKPISGAPKTAMVTANVGGVNASVIWISAVMLVRLGSAVDAVVMATAATGQVLLRHRFGWARLRGVNDRGSVMPQQVHRKRRVQGRERTDQLVCYTGYGGMSGPLSWGIQSGRFVLRNQRGGRFQLCCRSLRCKGYGLCDPVTGLCACNPGFTASNCDVKLTCPNDWKSDGICAFRKCMCGPSYTGEMQ